MQDSHEPDRIPLPEAGRPIQSRTLAPDLARGLMLLLIVISNTQFFLWGAEHGPSGWHPINGGPADQVARFLMITVLDLRVYPLFAFLFGYGMVQFFNHRIGAGHSDNQILSALRRRSLWLMIIGLAHGVLLLGGDILGAYGLMSLILGWIFLRRSGRAQLIGATVAVLLLVVLVALAALALKAGQATAGEVVPATAHYAAGEASYLASLGTRLSTWLLVTFGGGLLGFAFHAAMLVGFWAAKNRILEEPDRYLGLLWFTAIGGTLIGWAGGLPAALAHAGVLVLPDEARVENGLLFNIQVLTGLAGGLGYAAAFGLIARAMSGTVQGSLPVRTITAVGRRSLSSYLAHSVIFVPLLAAWGLGLGQYFGSAAMVGFAFAVWLVTAFACLGLERAGRRGPAEAFLRNRILPGARPGETGGRS